MDYKLFNDHITLQALLKDVGILSSGGAIKGFLAEQTVLFNGEDEKRRGKKIRIGDKISLPEQGVEIILIAPSEEEISAHQEELAEKERVAALVKELNKQRKTAKKSLTHTPTNKIKPQDKQKKPVRFPGT